MPVACMNVHGRVWQKPDTTEHMLNNSISVGFEKRQCWPSVTWVKCVQQQDTDHRTLTREWCGGSCRELSSAWKCMVLLTVHTLHIMCFTTCNVYLHLKGGKSNFPANIKKHYWQRIRLGGHHLSGIAQLFLLGFQSSPLVLLQHAFLLFLLQHAFPIYPDSLHPLPRPMKFMGKLIHRSCRDGSGVVLGSVEILGLAGDSMFKSI